MGPPATSPSAADRAAVAPPDRADAGVPVVAATGPWPLSAAYFGQSHAMREKS